jgi:hypothetical protein
MSIFSKWLSLIKGSILGNLLTGWVLSAKFTRVLPVFYAIALTFNTVFTVRPIVPFHYHILRKSATQEQN